MAVFALAGNSNTPIMFHNSRPGIHHGNDVIYDRLDVGVIHVQILTFGYQLKEVTGLIQ